MLILLDLIYNKQKLPKKYMHEIIFYYQYRETILLLSNETIRRNCKRKMCQVNETTIVDQSYQVIVVINLIK